LKISPIILFIIAGTFLAAFVVATVGGEHSYGGWLLMGFFAFLAMGFRKYELLRGYSYTIMIFAAVSLAMYYPQYFVSVGEFKTSKVITPLLQIIMFGMGTSLSLRDFAAIARMPKGVVAGIVCQYTIMPLLALMLTKVFSFPPEIAAGVILIGSCPSGLASNVMTFIAKGNLALSVTITAVTTILAPFVTPALMKFLGGQYVDVNFLAMLWDITKIIIIPIAGGLLFNYFLHGKMKWLDQMMPLLSMGGIAMVIVVVTANGRDNLMVVGPLLICAVLIHNTGGYLLGYWTARGLLRMSEMDSRTVAIEVGLQNAGLASGLSVSMGKMATVGLAAAVFGPTMNITGSTLALWWRSRPIQPSPSEKLAESTGT
jgi:bile acid:Na+ symporter, BASS family